MNKVKSNLPNVITFINLSFGMMAILLTVIENSVRTLIYASLLVMVAAVTDRLDGQVARKLGVTSEFGKQLDSLSDLVSFGVAPIIIAWKINHPVFTMYAIPIILLFPIAGAVRLARYNLSDFDNVFRGIPITVAGGLLAIVNIYVCFEQLSNKYLPYHAILTLVLIVFFSWLMISNVNIKKL